LVVLLSALIFVLFVAVLFRYGFISGSRLVTNKDLIDVGTKILASIVLTFGAVASYFRFFKGRTLSPRLTITAAVNVLPVDATKNFHVLSLDVKNVGSVAIWGLEPRVEIHFHGGHIRPEKDIDDWFTPLEGSDDRRTLQMLDTEESSQFVVQREVPVECWAVTYFAKVGLSSGHSWHRIVTASNRLEHKEK